MKLLDSHIHLLVVVLQMMQWIQTSMRGGIKASNTHGWVILKLYFTPKPH